MKRQEKLIISYSILIIILGIVSYLYLPDLMTALKSENLNFIGLVLEGEGDLKVRFGDSVNWRSLKKKDLLYSKTYLFTGEKSKGSFGFLDQSTINLGPNSLIYLDFVFEQKEKKKTSFSELNKSLAIDLLDGSAQFELKDKSNIKKIIIDNIVVNLSNSTSSIQIKHNKKTGMELSVVEGDVGITSEGNKYDIKAGEKVTVAESSQVEESKVEKISSEDLEEMKKLAQKDRALVLDSLNRVQLRQVLHHIIGLFGPGKKDYDELSKSEN